MIVHDLKTPLTSVLATTEMLIDGDFGELNDEQRRMLSDAEGKADDLLALIGDLLEVARIEEATMTLDLQPIAPAALLNEIVNEWSIRFQQEGATATVDVADDAPVFEADKPLLRRVLGNLVSNALTHSATAITLQLSARRDNDNVLFTLADNGPGIPPEYHEVIFRKFERVKNPNIPRTRSSGLGLAFCKLVVDAHGGRIWVQSAGEGKGSAFHFSLPVHPAHREVRVTSSGAVPA
jgi:signal transduction histidine kinase